MLGICFKTLQLFLSIKKKDTVGAGMDVKQEWQAGYNCCSCVTGSWELIIPLLYEIFLIKIFK